MDEVPELDGDSSASYAENGTGSVATYTATDPEEKDIVWTLLDWMTTLMISASTEACLKFDSPPDFEAGERSGDNEYEVTVNASAGADTDPVIKTATLVVTVTVTRPEDEPGSVMLSTLQPQVGVPL